MDTTAARANEGGSIRRGDLLLAIGNGLFLSHSIASDEITIGRDASCDFVIDHASLSRRHAVVRVATPPTVQDLGSTNGTLVHGDLVRGGAPITLEGQVGFQIGPFSFVVVSRTHADTPSRPSLRVEDPTPRGIPSLVRDFALTGASILITGETGVGKEVLASTVHTLSERTGDYVQVNCAALTETLLESELFGHERGAFTGAVAQKAGLIEAAARGTVFLDEIGEIPPNVQAKLLRAIERREVLRLGSTRPIQIDVRFVAATNRDLAAEVAAGRFRADLFYRLDGVTLMIPPLRERRGAIIPLAIELLAAAKSTAKLTSAAMAALEAHAWPGNVRELKAVLERAVVLCRGGSIDAKHLAFSATPPVKVVSTTPSSPEDAERARIVEALEQCAGNQSRAAKLLGISRTTLVTKIRLYNIARPHAKQR